MNARGLRSAVYTAGLAAVVAVQCGLWWAYYGFATKTLVGDEFRYRAEALALWQGLPSPPGFIWPPLQRWFLAALIGPLDGNLVVAQVVQMLLLGMCALLLRQIWLQLDPRPFAANLAALLFASSPAIMAFGLYLWPEPLHLVLLLGAIFLLVSWPQRWQAAAGGGILIGLALLSKSLLSGFWPLFLILFLRPPWRKSLTGAFVFVIALLVVIGPATLRGWQATGKPLIADSSMYNLYVGLQDDWRSDYIHDRGGPILREYMQSGDTPRERSNVFAQRIETRIAEQGLWSVLGHQLSYQYFRLFNAKRTMLSQLPGPACAGFSGAYTVPSHWVIAMRAATEAHYALVLIAAAFGIAFWCRSRPLAWLLALFFAYQMAIFLGLHVKARFLLPMLPFLCAFAGSALASIGRLGEGAGALQGNPISPLAAGSGPGSAHARLRWGTGMALALLLLLLAFAGPWLDQSCA